MGRWLGRWTSISMVVGVLTLATARPNVCGLEAEAYNPGRLWEAQYIHELFGTSSMQTRCDADSVVVIRSHEYFNAKWNRSANPDILFDLTDEGCERPHRFDDYGDFKLVFRQFACWREYGHLYMDHVFVLPVGYRIGTLRTNITSMESLRYLEDDADRARPLAWSFVGSVRPNRRKALETMKAIEPNSFGSGARELLFKQYSDSNFVVAPRGLVNLDCFRHSEASMAGAIPIVVGTDADIDDTFAHYLQNHGQRPPWLFASSWTNAKERTRELLNDRTALLLQRKAVLKWWHDVVTFVRNQVSVLRSSLHDLVRVEVD